MGERLGEADGLGLATHTGLAAWPAAAGEIMALWLHYANQYGTMMNMTTVTDQLRRAVRQSGQTRYAISKTTGIPASVLSRFVASGRGLRSENIDRLCTHLGLVLTTKAAKTRKGR